MALPLNTTINNQLESENLIFGKRGYDVIQDCFFVELINSKPNNEVKTFTDFSSYYSFLDGDIYDDAYYFQYNFTFDELNKYKIDKTKINYLPFGETISNCKIKVSDQEREEFKKREKDKKKIVKKVDIVNRCSNSHELIKEIRCWNREFYLWNYITHHGKESFDAIMDVINNGYADENLTKASIFLYGIENCKERYDCRCYKPKTNKKYNDKYKKYANKIKKDNLSIDKAIYFDKRTHFYCVETIIYTSPKRHTLIEDTDVHLFLYFSSFDELATYLHNDLSDCDL